MNIINKTFDSESIEDIKLEMNRKYSWGLFWYWLILFPLALFLAAFLPLVSIIIFIIDLKNRKKIHNDFMKAIGIYSLNPNMNSVYANLNDTDTGT